MGPLISAQNVVKSYGKHAVLQGINFEIQPGVTGLLGSNGAGKTTILGLILGLHPADSGTLSVMGSDPWKAGADVRTHLGYAPEHHTLPPDLKASEFVEHVAELHGLPTAEARTRASDALWLVGLGEERFRPLGTMSTGQRQRVKLAQAIAHDPKLIMLDEPTDGLDPAQRDNMLDVIKNVSTEFGINVLISSHLIDEVERICDGVVIIGDGVTKASGSLDELRGTAESFFRAEVDADAAHVAKLLATLETTTPATADGRIITMQGESDEMLTQFRDACVQHDVGIVRLEKNRVSLEDVFIESMS